MANITFPLSSVAQTLAKRSPFNAETDFAGVSIAVYVPFVITAHPSVPAKDLRDLGDAAAQQEPEVQLRLDRPRLGDARHRRDLQARRQGGHGAHRVQGRGAAQAGAALSGRIQVGGDQLSTSLAEIRAGQLKALATSGSKRIAMLPDVPTVRELGFASLEFEGWNGLLAPAKTPRAVIERLQRETAAAVRHPDVQKRFSDLGAEPVGSSSRGADRDRAPADEAVHAGDPGDEARLSARVCRDGAQDGAGYRRIYMRKNILTP